MSHPRWLYRVGAVSFAAAAGEFDPADAESEIYDAIVRIAQRA